MKHCPQCDTRYDEEVIKFCTKDGTPLIEDESPTFTALPSTTVPIDEIGEETVVIRRPAEAERTAEISDRSERIVIPTVFPEQPVRARAQAYYPPPAPPPNTARTVILTVLGTLAVLGLGAGLFWLTQSEPAGNYNINVSMPNQNFNANANMGFDSNFNFNSTANFNSNFNSGFNPNFNIGSNFNAATRSPTPIPRPTANTAVSPPQATSPTPRPSPAPTRENTNTNTRPAPTGTPRIGPRPPSTPGIRENRERLR
ncbi:MAG: hypothetical protein WKF34_07745 [Pyrinomonadaceae bacterium]